MLPNQFHYTSQRLELLVKMRDDSQKAALLKKIDPVLRKHEMRVLPVMLESRKFLQAPAEKTFMACKKAFGDAQGGGGVKKFPKLFTVFPSEPEKPEWSIAHAGGGGEVLAKGSTTRTHNIEICTKIDFGGVEVEGVKVKELLEEWLGDLTYGWKFVVSVVPPERKLTEAPRAKGKGKGKGKGKAKEGC